MIAIVFGGSGMLGQSFVSTLVRAGAQVLAPSHREVDITSEISVRNYITKSKPTYVINCAAFTDVDGCEKDPVRAYLMNSTAVAHISTACKKAQAKFIHISTDYVFDGSSTGPYQETDPVHPVQVYGQSKLEGERHALEAGGAVFRVQWLFGQGKANFVDWVARTLISGGKINIATTQYGSPSSTMFVANIICVSLHLCKQEIYHVSHDNYSSRMECAQYIADYLKKDARAHFNPLQSVSFGVAARPMNSCLNPERLKKLLGTNSMGSWQADTLTYLSTRYNVWNP